MPRRIDPAYNFTTARALNPTPSTDWINVERLSLFGALIDAGTSRDKIMAAVMEIAATYEYMRELKKAGPNFVQDQAAVEEVLNRLNELDSYRTKLEELTALFLPPGQRSKQRLDQKSRQLISQRFLMRTGKQLAQALSEVGKTLDDLESVTKTHQYSLAIRDQPTKADPAADEMALSIHNVLKQYRLRISAHESAEFKRKRKAASPFVAVLKIVLMHAGESSEVAAKRAISLAEKAIDTAKRCKQGNSPP